MSSLQNLQISQTFPGLIKTNNEAAIDGTLRTLQDGAGNDLPMEVSTAGVNFTGTVTGTPNTTYDYGAVGAAGNINMALSGSDTTNDVVTMQAGTNITLTDNGSNTFTIDAAGGGGGGGIEPIPIISLENYGPSWNYYSPTGGPGPYGRRPIGFSAYLPAGTYNKFNHWVRTAATTEGAVYDMAIYNTTPTFPSKGDPSFKPTTLVPNAIVTGISATTTGQKLITTALPFTVTGGWYYFAFRFDNGINSEFEGSYAGIATANGGWGYNVYANASALGFPTPYLFAQANWTNDALICGSVGEYTSMPLDLSGETTFDGTSYRVAFTIVAQ
jgi:hypothetical protein